MTSCRNVMRLLGMFALSVTVVLSVIDIYIHEESYELSRAISCAEFPELCAPLQDMETVPARTICSDERCAFGRWKVLPPLKKRNLSSDFASSRRISNDNQQDSSLDAEPLLNFPGHGMRAEASRLDTIFRHKRWSFFSFSTDRFFVGVALVQLNYASNAFLYVVDKQASTSTMFEYTFVGPLGRGITFADRSDDDTCSEHRIPSGVASSLLGGKQAIIRMCSERSQHADNAARDSTEVDAESLSWHVTANLSAADRDSGKPRRIVLDVKVVAGEPLIFSFPVGGDFTRPAYVHKAAGMTARGTLSVEGIHDEAFESSSATLDWTWSMPLRETRWKWASLSTRDAVTTVTRTTGEKFKRKRHIGINLSANVYDVSRDGVEPPSLSIENAVWLDNKVIPLNMPVQFHLPANTSARSAQNVWKIRSIGVDNNGSADFVDLVFTPMGSRDEFLNLGLVISEFTQPYGTFSGTVRVGDEVIEIVRVFGVVENHYAKW